MKETMRDVLSEDSSRGGGGKFGRAGGKIPGGKKGKGKVFIEAGRCRLTQ
jgi:hypothetical protein